MAPASAAVKVSARPRRAVPARALRWADARTTHLASDQRGSVVLNRLLAVPAVLCVVLAGFLGVWGWEGRDESRARAADEDLRREVESLLGPPVSGDYHPEDDFLHLQACDTLLRAATLDRTVGAGAIDPLAPDPAVTTLPSDPTNTLPAVEAATALRNMLDPIVVSGLPGLDEPEVHAAMAHLRDQIDGALAVEHDPFASPNVQGAAQELGNVVFVRC